MNRRPCSPKDFGALAVGGSLSREVGKVVAIPPLSELVYKNLEYFLSQVLY